MKKLIVISFLVLSINAFADQKVAKKVPSKAVPKKMAVKAAKVEEPIPGFVKQMICDRKVMGSPDQKKSTLDLKKKYGCK